MKTQHVSIALATYNGEKHLGEQLESIEKQSILPFEVIVYDDASTDGTLDIVEKFKGRAGFEVKIKRNDYNIGYRKNFIECAKACRGDIVIFCDQDDVWHKNKIQEIVKYFSESDNIALTHDCSVNFTANEDSLDSYFDHLGLSGFNPDLNIKGCCMAYRRDLIDLVGYPPSDFNWGHDNWISFTSKALNRHGTIPKQLIEYRIHGSNTSGALPGGRCRIRRLLRSLKLGYFSSASQLENYVSYYVKPTEIEMHYSAINQFRSALSETQMRQAYEAIASREKICRFWEGKEWSRPISRTLLAIRFFLTGAYRSNDGLLGFIQDVYGNRNGRL